MINPLPFHFRQDTFLSHHGVSRCSRAAVLLWLKILEEGYCTSQMSWTTIRCIAKQYALPTYSLAIALHELLEQQVCRFEASGSIIPIGAEYLLPDFWVKVRNPPPANTCGPLTN